MNLIPDAKLAQIRFDVGKENAKVHVKDKPRILVRFSTRTWSIRSRELWDAVSQTSYVLTELGKVFP